MTLLLVGVGVVVLVAVFVLLAARSPMGFECDRCGFLHGTSEDEEIHRRTHDIVDNFERETAA